MASCGGWWDPISKVNRTVPRGKHKYSGRLPSLPTTRHWQTEDTAGQYWLLTTDYSLLTKVDWQILLQLPEIRIANISFRSEGTWSLPMTLLALLSPRCGREYLRVRWPHHFPLVGSHRHSPTSLVSPASGQFSIDTLHLACLIDHQFGSLQLIPLEYFQYFSVESLKM